MRFDSLNDWLNWQETLNPAEIELGLERVSQVLEQAGLANHFNCSVITVAGTNGKGSVVAFLEAIATAAGLNVCSYTSPHLFNYNERIRVNQQPVTDAVLCDAFAFIDEHRKDVPLTYFEFGTLAALSIFSTLNADLIVLEVGLGGRLDAVNVIQPSVAVITSIALDHIDWLGDTRESITKEKAGICRPQTPAICGDKQPPANLYQIAQQLGADLHVLGQDYSYQLADKYWNLHTPYGDLTRLAIPKLAGEFQLGNAATAIFALQCLQDEISFSSIVLNQGLQTCRLSARFETVHTGPLVQVDVAHNPQAAAALVSMLTASTTEMANANNDSNNKGRGIGKCYAIIAMLADKDVEQVVEILNPCIDVWCIAGLPTIARGLNVTQLRKRLHSSLTDVKLQSAETVKQACELMMAQLTKNDRVIIFGSFHTAAEAIDFFENYETLQV